MLRRAEQVLALLVGLAVAPAASTAHEALSLPNGVRLEDEFVKGVF